MISRYIVVVFILSFTAIAIVLPKTKFSGLISASQASSQQIIAKKNTTYPLPIQNFQEAPETSAKSIAIIDSKSGISLYEKDANSKHLPASTTKMMTALVALENCSPKDVVTAGHVQKEGTQMGLEESDKVTVENLLYGLLLPSGNDAAYALANGCAPSFNDFIADMNQKAQDLEMLNTHFINPAGFDDNLQYSSALDLARLGKVVVANPLISKIVATKNTVVTDVTGTKTYSLENVNKLLGVVDGVEGVKTGQTEGSQEILVSEVARNGNTVVIALMGSQDRFAETEKLIDWVFKNYTWPKQITAP